MLGDGRAFFFEVKRAVNQTPRLGRTGLSGPIVAGSRDLVRVNVELLGQLHQRLLALDGRQSHLGFECRAMIPARSSRHGSLLALGNHADVARIIHLSPLSKFPQPPLPKAMPVIRTEPDEWQVWLDAPWSEAKALQRALPDGALRIVLRGEKEDYGSPPATT